MLFKSTTCYEFVTSADNVVMFVPLKFSFDSNYLLAIAKPKNGKVSYVYLKTKFWSVLKIIPLHRLVVFLFADNKEIKYFSLHVDWCAHKVNLYII